MNLVIDIGNSQIKLAWFEQGGKLIETIRQEKSAVSVVFDLIENKPAEKAIVSSVGLLEAVFKDQLERIQGKLVFLDHQTPLPIIISYKSPETLGHDRIAAAAGAHQLFHGSNVLIIDMGTAITIDFLSSTGIYLGGNISPGLQTRFRALKEYTAKLPLVSRDNAFPRFGTDTRTAIAAGVQQGIVYELDRYVNEFTHDYPDCEFIMTGGDTEFFVSELKRPIFAKPDLVLDGLNYILEFNTTD
jgi:type III pantothenate kinase